MRVATSVNTVGDQDSIKLAFFFFKKKEHRHWDETLQEFIIKQYYNFHLVFERKSCLILCAPMDCSPPGSWFVPSVTEPCSVGRMHPVCECMPLRGMFGALTSSVLRWSRPRLPELMDKASPGCAPRRGLEGHGGGGLCVPSAFLWSHSMAAVPDKHPRSSCWKLSLPHFWFAIPAGIPLWLRVLFPQCLKKGSISPHVFLASFLTVLLLMVLVIRIHTHA